MGNIQVVVSWKRVALLDHAYIRRQTTAIGIRHDLRPVLSVETAQDHVQTFESSFWRALIWPAFYREQAENFVIECGSFFNYVRLPDTRLKIV